ncbi:Akirin-1 [Oopsacas minuta]|uniref:Akirin-1 n=1 Tax=Oopsacas minuta TaxID=111878 RepID=A0AAV7K2T0_9METZ|nr:Akirin-1 [Oopsacas minuta]
MACATIKRSIDLSFYGDTDSSSPSHKRSRCSSLAGLSPWRSAAEKRRRRILRFRQNELDTCESPRKTTDYMQLFPETESIDSEEFIRINLQDEVKRLKHRNQLSFGPSTSHQLPTCTPLVAPTPHHSLSVTNPPLTSINCHTPPATSSRDQPLFTLKQVETICSRLLHENEEKLREQYGQALSEKLNEQYVAFLKFTQDNIQKQFSNTTCSYIM